jgi:hypothetical protein
MSDSASVDFEILRTVYSRLRNTERFKTAELQPSYAPNSLVLRYDLSYFPSFVEEAFLELSFAR